MNAMTLSLLVPLSAAAVYAGVGWRPRTRWLAAAAGSAMLAWSVSVLVVGGAGVDHNQAVFIAAISAVWLLAGIMWPAYVAHEVADRKIGARAARWSAAVTMAILTALVAAVLVGDIGLSWLMIAVTVVPTAALMTYQRRAPGEAAARRLIKAAAGPLVAGAIGAVSVWTSGPSGWAMILLGMALMTQVAVVPVGLARVGVMSHLPAPSAIVVFACVPVAAAAVVLRWSGQAAVGLGVTGARSLLLMAGMLVLAAGIGAMLWSRDLRSLLGYIAAVGGGFALLLAAAGPEAAGRVAVFTAAFGAVIASLIVATADVIRVIGSSSMGFVAGWRDRSGGHAMVMMVALAMTIAVPAVAVWFSQLDRWGMWPPALAAVVAMAAAVIAAGRRISQPGPHPHVAQAKDLRAAGLPVMVSGVVVGGAAMVAFMPWLG